MSHALHQSVSLCFSHGQKKYFTKEILLCSAHQNRLFYINNEHKDIDTIANLDFLLTSSPRTWWIQLANFVVVVIADGKDCQGDDDE